MPIDKTKTPLTIEQAKKVKQAFQKAIEDGDIIAAKAFITKQLENVSDESGSYQDKPYLFQATGTDSNTTETPTAPVAKHLELRGNTVVFNQLVNANTTEIIPTAGHKYLTMLNGVKSIITLADDTPISVSGGTDNVFDLTRMFGVGKEPTSVVQFNRLFPLPYYAYNVGELKSCQSNKLITIGYNQFENLNQFIRVVAGQTYRLMYWNGTALAALTSGSIEEYDGSQTLIQTTTYDNLSDLHTVDNSYPDNSDKGIKLSDETQWVKIVSSSNTNILFNIAWDGSRLDYESYVKHEYTLPNWSGRSVPVVYDSYYPNGTIIQRIKHCIYDGVNRGVDTSRSGISPGIYNVFGDYTVFYLYRDDMRDIEKVGNYYDYGRESKARCSIPLIQNPGSAQLGIWLYYIETNLQILLSLPTTTAATVEQANTWLQNNNVELQAALAEPIITTGHQTFPENVEVDDFGTMWFTTSETESASNPIIPQGNQFFYPADYALLIDDLNQYTKGDVQVLAKKSDLDRREYVTVEINTTDYSAGTISLVNENTLNEEIVTGWCYYCVSAEDGVSTHFKLRKSYTATSTIIDQVFNLSNTGNPQIEFTSISADRTTFTCRPAGKYFSYSVPSNKKISAIKGIIVGEFDYVGATLWLNTALEKSLWRGIWSTDFNKLGYLELGSAGVPANDNSYSALTAINVDIEDFDNIISEVSYSNRTSRVNRNYQMGIKKEGVKTYVNSLDMFLDNGHRWVLNGTQITFMLEDI